jgi:hypothetical protein
LGIDPAAEAAAAAEGGWNSHDAKEGSSFAFALRQSFRRICFVLFWQEEQQHWTD